MSAENKNKRAIDRCALSDIIGALHKTAEHMDIENRGADMLVVERAKG